MYGEDNSSYPGGGMIGAALRARQLFNLIQNSQYVAEDRRTAAENRKLGLEDRQREIANQQRAQSYQDAQFKIGLNNEGAQAANPTLESLLDQTMGPVANPRMKVDTPAGSYYLPSHDERQQSALRDLMAKAQAQAYGKLSEQRLLMPGQVEAEGKKATARETAKRAAEPKYKLAPDVAQFLGKDEATKDEIDAYVKQHNASSPNFHVVTSTDDQGNVTAVGINPKTFERTEPIQLGQIGKSKSEPGENPGQIFTKMKEFENARAEAQKLHNQADIFEKAAETSTDPDKAEEYKLKAEAARKQGDSQLDFSTTLANNLSQIFPGQIEAGAGKADTRGKQWPYAKIIRGAASTTSPKAASQAGPKVYPASKLQDYAKKWTKGDVNAARKELNRGGFEIQEDK